MDGSHKVTPSSEERRELPIRNEWVVDFYPTPLLLLGPPGVGKSETVRRIAEKLAISKGLRFVELDHSNFKEVLRTEGVFVFFDLRLTEVEPSDLLGVPREEDGGITYKPQLWSLCFSKHPGVLFLDELTNVQREDVIAAAYKLLLDRRAGNVRFRDDVWVVAAGNRPEDSSVARLLPAPLMDRVTRVDFGLPKIEEWAEYMNANGDWDTRVLAYLKRFPEDFLKPPSEPETLENFPTPRSWTRVAQWFPRMRSENSREALCTGNLGVEVGGKFLTFIRNPVPSPEELVQNPKKFKELSLDQKYIFTVVLSNWLREDIRRKTKKAVNLVKVMAEDDREFIMLAMITLPTKERAVFFNELVRADRATFMPIFRDIAQFIVA